MVLLCGSTLVLINEVTLRRAQLVLGSATVFLNVLVQLPVWETYLSITSHPGQLSLAIPPLLGAIGTSRSGRVVMLCSWEVKAGMVFV